MPISEQPSEQPSEQNLLKILNEVNLIAHLRTGYSTVILLLISSSGENLNQEDKEGIIEFVQQKIHTQEGVNSGPYIDIVLFLIHTFHLEENFREELENGFIDTFISHFIVDDNPQIYHPVDIKRLQIIIEMISTLRLEEKYRYFLCKFYIFSHKKDDIFKHKLKLLMPSHQVEEGDIGMIKKSAISIDEHPNMEIDDIAISSRQFFCTILKNSDINLDKNNFLELFNKFVSSYEDGSISEDYIRTLISTFMSEKDDEKTAILIGALCEKINNYSLMYTLGQGTIKQYGLGSYFDEVFHTMVREKNISVIAFSEYIIENSGEDLKGKFIDFMKDFLINLDNHIIFEMIPYIANKLNISIITKFSYIFDHDIDFKNTLIKKYRGDSAYNPLIQVLECQNEITIP